MSRSMPTLAAALAAATLMAAAGTAQAHAHLTASTPAAGSTVGHIKHIELHFTEALAAKFSTVDLVMTSMAMGGKMVDDHMPITKLTTSLSPTDPATLLVELKAPLSARAGVLAGLAAVASMTSSRARAASRTRIEAPAAVPLATVHSTAGSRADAAEPAMAMVKVNRWTALAIRASDVNPIISRRQGNRSAAAGA